GLELDRVEVPPGRQGLRDHDPRVADRGADLEDALGLRDPHEDLEERGGPGRHDRPVLGGGLRLEAGEDALAGADEAAEVARDLGMQDVERAGHDGYHTRMAISEHWSNVVP